MPGPKKYKVILAAHGPQPTSGPDLSFREHQQDRQTNMHPEHKVPPRSPAFPPQPPAFPSQLPGLPPQSPSAPPDNNGKDDHDDGNGGGGGTVGQINSKANGDDDQNNQPSKSPSEISFDGTGPKPSSNKLKLSFTPGINMGPDICWRANQLPRYSEKSKKGPNLDWRRYQRPSARRANIGSNLYRTDCQLPRQPNRPPQPSVPIRAPPSPAEEQQFCYSNSRYDGDDSTQPVKRRRSSPLDLGPNTQISSVQEDDAYPFIEKPELPSPVSSVPAEGQPSDQIKPPIIVVNSSENDKVDLMVSPEELPAWYIAIIAPNKKKSRKNCSQEACEDALRGQKRKRSDA